MKIGRVNKKFMILVFYSLNYSADSFIQKRKTLIRKDSKNEFSVLMFFVGTKLSRNVLSDVRQLT